MNWRRGLLRLWVAMTIFWVLAYSYALWADRLYDLRDANTNQPLDIVAFRTRPWEKAYVEPKDFKFLDYLGLLSGLAGPPLAVLLAGRTACWVGKGFKV
jgi:hypothetical protein